MVMGARIREARHGARLTQAALARAAGVSERNIVRWENDQHSPRAEHVAAIAKATGKDETFFFHGELAADDDEESRSPVEDLMAAIRRIVAAEVKQQVSA